MPGLLWGLARFYPTRYFLSPSWAVPNGLRAAGPAFETDALRCLSTAMNSARQYNPATMKGKGILQDDAGDVSQLLRAWSSGDQLALGELTPVVYAELRRLARRYMRGERPDHSLQATALVNEAYIRLVDYKRMQWQNRAHFFAVSAQLMRRILVERAAFGRPQGGSDSACIRRIPFRRSGASIRPQVASAWASADLIF